jgi:hypothetical protein
MNPTRKVVLNIIAAVIILSLACSLGSITGGSPPSSSNGGNPPASSSSGVDLEAFAGGPDLPLVRSDTKNFSADQFAALSLPVTVTFSGDETADVIFKGALAEPNYNVSATPLKFLNIFVVLKKNLPTGILYQDGSSIVYDQYIQAWHVEMLDSSGNVLSTSEVTRYAPLLANVTRAVAYGVEQIPDNTSSVKVTISITKEKYGLSCVNPTPSALCATTDDLDFQMPDPIVYHTPIQISFSMDDWNETYAKKAVVGALSFQNKNPFNLTMQYYTTLLFLDDSGSLVGYWNNYYYVDPNGIDTQDTYADLYFSGIPTRVLVYDRAELKDLIEATR